MAYARATTRRALGDYAPTPEPLVEYDPSVDTYRPAGGGAVTRDYLTALARLSAANYSATAQAAVPSSLITVTPDLFNQYLKYNNVGWGDGGAALNAALLEWAQSGTWQTARNPDGTPSGISVADAPTYVQDQFRALFGDANYAVMTGQATTGGAAPGAIAPPPAAAIAPPQYFQGGVRFDSTGVVYDGTGAPTGKTLSADQVAALLTPQPAGTAMDVDVSSIPDAAIYAAVDAVTQAGGDPTQPTALVDKNSGAQVATIQQLSNGSLSVTAPSSGRDLAGIVNTVTGFIDQIGGTLTNVGTEVKKIGNAVNGAATGAQAGYNAPTSWTPILLVGGAVLAGALLLKGKR